MTYVVVLIVILIFAAGLAFALRGRGGSDGVASFRRQIDALSPEARKPTVDQVKSAERDNGDARTAGRPDGPDAADGDQGDSVGEDS